MRGLVLQIVTAVLADVIISCLPSVMVAPVGFNILKSVFNVPSCRQSRCFCRRNRDCVPAYFEHCLQHIYYI